MRDLVDHRAIRPFGYFVHHQGRGHAERCAAIVSALPPERPVTVFCARPEILGPMPAQVTVVRIPSLFEPRGDEPRGMDAIPTPETLHCAPLGWAGIREATGRIAGWFAEADPALMICDVSAELAQLCRICSVPHVKVLQHGERRDAGHRAAYDGAVGLLAPFDAALSQPDWPDAMRARTCFAGGLGVRTGLPSRADARRRLEIPASVRMTLVISGSGGNGFAAAALGVGARTFPEDRWITIGSVQRDWHATEPSNLHHAGWVADPCDHIAAADLIVSSAGNTTCQMVLASSTPWIVIPEWRYFDEQIEKARALARAGVAWHLSHPPSSADAWRRAIEEAIAGHDAGRQRALVRSDAAAHAAAWLEALSARLWDETPLALTPATETIA